MNVKHKVVRNISEYKRQLHGQQRGKFITIYTGDYIQAQLVLINIDKELIGFRSAPVPLARDQTGSTPYPKSRLD